jgi:Gram-negative bacterial TonB protein C-terminal
MPSAARRKIQSAPDWKDAPLFAAVSGDLGRSRLPGRGLLYSFVVHEIFIFWILCSPGGYSVPERHFRVVERLSLDSELTYALPPLGGGSSHGGQPGTAKGPRGKKGGASPGARKSSGHVHRGPQPVTSKPPNPDNPIQTVLQPDLVKPPVLAVPLPLPNIVQLATLPPPPAVLPVLHTPAPLKPPEAPKLEASLRAATFSIPPIEIAPPPPEATPKLTLPPPTSEAATLPTSSKLASELARATPSAPAPAAPQSPPARTESAGTDARNLLVLSPIPSPPTLGGQVPVGEAHGEFAIGLEPIEAPKSQVGAGDATAGATEPEIASLPSGSTGPSLAQLASGLGNGTGSDSEVGNGTGAEAGTGLSNGAVTGPGSGHGNASGPGGGVGLGTGTGTGAGVGPGRGPFSGMSITGGKGGTARSGSPSGRTYGPEITGSYGITVVANGPSGGGLRDFGVFLDEPVYTVYINMRRADDPAPSWTMEYALLREPPAADPPASDLPPRYISLKAGPQSETALLAPYATTKESPQLPPEVISRYSGQMIVVYGEIGPDGKFEKPRIMASPNPQLNPPVLAALAKWVFQPALLIGKPVAVKALIGIPISLPQ